MSVEGLRKKGKYIPSTSMVATKDTMALASTVLGVEILELWTEAEGDSLSCTYVHAWDSIMDLYPNIISGHYPEQKAEHKLSPQLCKLARESPNRYHWRVATGVVEHDQSPLNRHLRAPLLTEFAYLLQAETEGVSVYLVGFSLNRKKFSPQKLKFLEGLGFAIYIVACGFDDDSGHADTNELDAKTRALPLAIPPVVQPATSANVVVGIASVSPPPSVPTWSPTYRFSFPVSSIPVANPVPDNLTLQDFTEIKHIADGSNSNVFLCNYGEEKVILKMIKEDVQSDVVAMHEFDVEHGILSRLNHPNIVQLRGAGHRPRRFLVLEYMEGGSLQTILMQNQAKPGLAQKLFRKPTFTYANLLLRARDIAEAFMYLHEGVADGVSIIHRDLKPDNIGFAADGTLKLIDFGLCTCVNRRRIKDESYEMTGNTGSLRYMAPEVALKRSYTELVDVYSFGILVWQMAKDKLPFKGFNKDEFIRNVVVGRQRPKIGQSWPTAFSSLLQRCWETSPFDRPTFVQIVAELNQLIGSGTPTGVRASHLKAPPVASRGKGADSTWF